MKQEVLIKIKGTQRIDQEADSVELVTGGYFYEKNGIYYLTYDESEATGYAGCKTTLKIEPGHRATMIRYGESRSQLVIEPGVRHQCYYDTGYGPLMVGVMGDKLETHLDHSGGSVFFSYSLDINTSLASENEINIIVITSPAAESADVKS